MIGHLLLVGSSPSCALPAFRDRRTASVTLGAGASTWTAGQLSRLTLSARSGHHTPRPSTRSTPTAVAHASSDSGGVKADD